MQDKRFRVPAHVVYREFGNETVILNLQTGKYHGLNQTAGVMLEALTESPTVGDAVDRLMIELEQPREVIRADVSELCRALVERQLIEQDASDID